MLNASLADEGMKYEDSMPKPSICGFRYYNVQQDETVYSVTTRRIPGSAAAFTFLTARFKRASGTDSKKAAHTECGGLVGLFGLTPVSWAGTIILQPGLAPCLPGQPGQSTAAQVSGAHLPSFCLAESLISEAFSLVLSHIELSDEELSLVMVSVG